MSTTLEEVLENPADLELRLRYADTLSAAGDPRGEFIRVQIGIGNGNPDPKLRRREDALWKEHRTRWCMPLLGLARDGARFRNGFVDEAVLFPKGGDFRDALVCRHWCTVRRVSLWCAYGELTELAASPVFRSVVAVFGNMQIRAMAPCPRIEELGVDVIQDDDHLRAFPNLKRLYLGYPGGTPVLPEWLPAETIEVVAPYGHADNVPSALRRLPPAVEVVRVHPKPARTSLLPEGVSTPISFRRDEEGRFRRLQLDYPTAKAAANAKDLGWKLASPFVGHVTLRIGDMRDIDKHREVIREQLLEYRNVPVDAPGVD